MRDLEAFNSMISHDLRAPLTTIELNCANLLRRESLSSSGLEKIERVRRAVRQMVNLINDLLSLARVGQGLLNRTEIDLATMSTEIIANLRRDHPDREVDVKVEPGLTCPGDLGLLRVVMENLLGNAWKYSSKLERARIEIGSINAFTKRTFFVRDNGAGFDMNEASRLFSAFQRLHSSTEFEGTGVGLATVHRIIDRHGGRIWAESTPGQGATFYFEVE
jgi:signal transduction histidine kinase